MWGFSESQGCYQRELRAVFLLLYHPIFTKWVTFDLVKVLSGFKWQGVRKICGFGIVF